MCSGLNNECVKSTKVLDIVVSFKKNRFKYTFQLPVRIAEDSNIDLILGLDTIKKLSLVKIVPEFFQNMDQIVHTDAIPSPWVQTTTASTDEVQLTIPSTTSGELIRKSTTLLQAEEEIVHMDIVLTDVSEDSPRPSGVPQPGSTLDITPVDNHILSLPPAIYDSEGLKPSAAHNRWQDNLAVGGACTKPGCTSSCGCPKVSIAAAMEVPSGESSLLSTVVSTPMLAHPRQSG
jgi:hypothetical protein